MTESKQDRDRHRDEMSACGGRLGERPCDIHMPVKRVLRTDAAQSREERSSKMEPQCAFYQEFQRCQRKLLTAMKVNDAIALLREIIREKRPKSEMILVRRHS